MSPLPMNKRIQWALAIVQVLFFGLVVRLFWVQWAESDHFDARSKQYRTAVRDKVKRGVVYDRNYHELALSKNMYSLGINPQYYRDLAGRQPDHADKVEAKKQLAADILASHTKKTREQILALLNSNRGFEWLERRVEFSVIQQIEDALREHRITWFPKSGVEVFVEERRFYPRGELAAHIVGYTNIDGVGQEGVELSYEDELKSQDVAVPTVKDGKGRAIDPFVVAANLPATSESIVTTIDERIQYALETELAAQCRQFSASGGVGIVMNPKTGEILAMSNYPAFDLNKYNDPAIQSLARKNRATWWPYEPGSVFKVVTFGALLDLGRVTPDEMIHCENGRYKPHPKLKIIKDAHPYGELTAMQVLTKSSNIGTLKLAQRMNATEYHKYLEGFGLTARTGVDLPYERRGSVAQVDPNVYYGMYFAPWGQGITVTPLQMLNAVNGIANKGVLMKPYVVKQIINPDGTLAEDRQPVMASRAISEQAAMTLTQMMVAAVESGTGKAAKLDGILVAGKTGTSQKASEETRGYLSGKYMSSFVGFFPAANPEYSMLILVDEPHGLHYGGQVAAPVFQRVGQQILSHQHMNALASQRARELPNFDFRPLPAKVTEETPKEPASPATPVALTTGSQAAASGR